MPTQEPKSVLPDKPSDLIYVALRDLAKCERSPKYNIDMTDWHYPADDGVCEVCLAGSVMAKTFKVDRNEDLTPCGIGIAPSDALKLGALNHFRAGEIIYGLREINLHRSKEAENIKDIVVQQYHDNPTKFKANMRKIARHLKSIGL